MSERDADVVMVGLWRKCCLIWHGGCVIYRDDGNAPRAVKFLLRAILTWPLTLPWLIFMQERDYLRSAPIAMRTVLCDKIHRPFARRGLGMRGRIAVLTAHFRAVDLLFPATTNSLLVSGERLPLASLAGSDQPYAVTLSREIVSQHQGELALMLLDPGSGLAIARLLFNLSLDDKRLLSITGLQGPPSEHRQRIVGITRDLDGLRPKQVVLAAACAFARWMGAEMIIATGNRNHVTQTRQVWRERIFADYDQFWREFAPEPLESGDFSLKLTLPRRCLEEVPGKKRKLWLRRCVRLDLLDQEIATSLDRLAAVTSINLLDPVN